MRSSRMLSLQFFWPSLIFLTGNESKICFQQKNESRLLLCDEPSVTYARVGVEPVRGSSRRRDKTPATISRTTTTTTSARLASRWSRLFCCSCSGGKRQNLSAATSFESLSPSSYRNWPGPQQAKPLDHFLGDVRNDEWVHSSHLTLISSFSAVERLLLSSISKAEAIML